MEEQPVDTTLYSLGEAVPGPEKRTGARHLTLYRVGALTLAHGRELCLIKNLSSGGMRIRVYCRLVVGQRLTVELKDGKPIAATVVWVEGNCAGIRFAAPVDILRLLGEAMDGPRPRMPRIEVRCIVSVRVGARVHGLLARDVSQGGVKVEARTPLLLGSSVMVTLPGLAPRPGVVRWSDSGCFGITFDHLLALPELVAWLQDQRQALRASA